MNALNDTTTTTVRRGPISPWWYRHLHAVVAVRLVVGAFLVGLGVVLLTHGSAGWAVLPLAGAVAHFALAYWQLTVARSGLPRLSGR